MKNLILIVMTVLFMASCTITKPIYTDVNVGMTKQEMLAKKNLRFKVRKSTDSLEVFKATKNIWSLVLIWPVIKPEVVYIYFEDDKAFKIDRGQGLEARINHRQQVDLNVKKN